MWNAFIRFVQEVFAIPPEPSHDPGARTNVLRPAPGWWHYRMAVWWSVRLATLASLIATLTVVELSLAEHMPWLARNLLRLIEYGSAALWLLSLPVGYALARLDYEMRWYLVGDRSVRIREGVVVVHEMTLTFANVQNVTIEQGPLQRLFGIADLRVQTAGGGGGQEQHGVRSMHTGVLRGLDNAPALREAVLARLRAAADTGLGDLDDVHTRSADTLASAATALLGEARALARAAERCVPPARS